MVSNLAENLDIKIISDHEIVKAPVKWCSVQLSEMIARDKRLEASVFDVEAKKSRALITTGKYPFVPLLGKNGLIKKAYYPGRFKRIYCENQNGEAFYLPSQMADIYPKPEKYISALTKCSIEELRLKANTLLLTRSGTIGTISLVSKTLEGKVFSDDVIRITFDKIEDLGYSYAYLKSSTGSVVLQTNGYGSVITHLEPEHLGEIPIPNPPTEVKQKIHNLIMKSFELRDESNELIDRATQLMVEELQLPPIRDLVINRIDNTSPVETFFVKLSEMKGRADASYHVPTVEAIIKHLQKHAAEVTTIGNSKISRDIVLPGRFKRVYVEENYGVMFFSGKNITELDPSDKHYLSFSQHDAKIKDELTIKENMVLITCSGSIGKIALVPKHWNNWAMTHDIIRLIPQDNLEGYVYIWLQSEYAAKMLESYAYGSVVSHIEKFHLADMQIPLLKRQDIQKHINDLALEANAKRYEAYQLEQEALRIMDEEVIYSNC